MQRSPFRPAAITYHPLILDIFPLPAACLVVVKILMETEGGVDRLLANKIEDAWILVRQKVLRSVQSRHGLIFCQLLACQRANVVRAIRYSPRT